MTKQEKKAYLEKYGNSKRNIARINLQIENIRIAQISPSANIGDGMPHAHNKTDMSDYIVRLDKVLMKLTKAMNENKILLVTLTDAINNLENDSEKDVLYLRYIQLMKWEEIEEYMSYSHKHIFRIHDKALQNLELT